MNLRDLSDDELRALLAQTKAKPKKGLDAIDQAMMDPTAGQSWSENALAGLGKSGYDAARGIGNIVTDLFPGAANLGFATRADTDATQKRDAALMDSSGGFWGNLLGQVGMAAALPAATIPKAALAGAAMGFAQPVGTHDSRTENTALSGMFGAAVPAAVAGARGVKAIAEPIIAPQRTAARIVEQFADDPVALRKAAMDAAKPNAATGRSMGEIIPGSAPTLAQLAQQPGISSLERGAMNQPGPLQKAMTDRGLDQNAARVKVLDDLSGKDGKLEMYKQSRAAVSEELYAAAMAETPGDTSWIKGEVTKLMQRPAFVSALKDGQEMMLNLGGKVDPQRPEYATEILHYTKLALDDGIEKATAQSNGNKARALIGTRDKLVSLMESKDFSPSYREARDTYKQMSKPVNEMELAGELRSKLVPAMQEGADRPTSLNAGSFAQAMRARAGDIGQISPEGKAGLEGVFADLQRAGKAESLGKAKGSPTAQFLTTQNLMRQIAGPVGLPQGLADKATAALMGAPVVGSALQWGTKGAEARMQQELAQMLLNPQTYSQAAALINKQPGLFGKTGRALLPYLPAQGPGAGLALSGMFADRPQ